MKISTVKIIAVLSALTICVTAFAACSKNSGISTDPNDLLYESEGKIYYRKEKGEAAYELVTDSKGVTVVDEQGNLLWKVTDSQGNEQTHPVSYPAFLAEGDRISCQQFTIKLPKDWENKGYSMMQLRDKEGTTKIDYSFLGADEEGVIPTAESKTEELKTLMKPAVDEGKMTFESTKTQVAGRDAVKVVLKADGEKPSYLEVYFVNVPSGVMSFSCACPYENGGKFDFKAILDTIEYRI